MIPGVVTLDKGPDQSPGVRPISPSHYLGTKGNQEGWPILGGVQIRYDRGSTPWSGYFSGPVSKG